VGVCALADGEFVRGDQPLRFVAYVDEYLVPVYPDDLALDDVPVLEIYEDALVDGTSPFSSRKKSFMVNSRDTCCVVSVMKQLLSFSLLDGCRLYSNSAAPSCQRSAISYQLFRLTADR
jgi:hypothetical protein